MAYYRVITWRQRGQRAVLVGVEVTGENATRAGVDPVDESLLAED